MFYKNGNIEFEISGGELPNDGILFVDHSKTGRSGHLGHAMVECANKDIICFYANCSGDILDGHSGYGWMEFKRSTDGGETWSDGRYFPYSKELYDMNIGVTALCEKAVLAPNGDIIIFNLTCEIHTNVAWEPYGLPTYIKSSDNGKTWSKAYRFCNQVGRIYDAKVKDGKIYVLMEYGDRPCGRVEYHMFVSSNNGESFEEISALPFMSRIDSIIYYGTMEWLKNGDLIVYIYRENCDETHPDYAVSSDGGKTWSAVKTAYFAKRIRNPQMVKLENTFFMFGRSGTKGDDKIIGHNVIYCSDDGINWDEGRYLKMRTHGIAAYSNTLLVNSTDPSKNTRILYQSSYAYDKNRTNIFHWWIDYKEKN